MITRDDILKDLTDWRSGKMGYHALLDAIDTYAGKDKILEKIDKLIEKANHECTLSGNVDAKRYLKSLKKWIINNKKP